VTCITVKSSSEPRLSSWLASRLPDDSTKVASWKSFLSSCMAWDPESRSSAETLLSHQLFAEINKDSAVTPDSYETGDQAGSVKPLVHMYTCTQIEGALSSERKVRCACHPSKFFEPKPTVSASYKLHGSDYTAIRKIKEDLRSSTWLCRSEVKPNE
jgi:serine/threonine protein kinase